MQEENYIQESEMDLIASDISKVREWLINNKSPNVKNYNEDPLWFKAVCFKNEEVIDEVILAGADLNVKNHNDTTWTIACINNGISTWLFQQGFSTLNNLWWKPNKLEEHPFYIKGINPDIMFLLCSRLRIDSISWEALHYNGTTPEEFHAENKAVLKIILKWKKLINDSNLPTIF